MCPATCMFVEVCRGGSSDAVQITITIQKPTHGPWTDSLGSFDFSDSSSNITVGLASAPIHFELSQHRSGNASKLNAFPIDGVCDSRANHFGSAAHAILRGAA